MLTCAPIIELCDKNVMNLQSQSDPTPMTTPIIGYPIAIEVGSFLKKKIPSLTSRLIIKETYLIAQAFQTPTIYLTLHIFTSTSPKTLNLIATQTLLLYFVGGEEHCCS